MASTTKGIILAGGSGTRFASDYQRHLETATSDL